MTMPRRTFLGITSVAVLAGARLGPRRSAANPAAAGRRGAGRRADGCPSSSAPCVLLRIGSASQHGGLMVFWLTKRRTG